MVISKFDSNIKFPVARKLRKTPALALAVFATSIIVSTTVAVNLFLFTRGCDLADSNMPFTEVKELQGDAGSRAAFVPAPNNPPQRAPAQPDQVRMVSGPAPDLDISATFIFDNVKGRITFPKPISRSVIGEVVEHMKLKTGFEVGVRQGVFSKEMLRQWNSARNYFLVDLWSNPDKFLGGKNLQSTQEQNMRDAFENTSPWKQKITFCKNFSTVCAERVEDNTFDFGYIDARHDFKSVYEDIGAWYPKIRTGGVMSGHDYMSGLEANRDGITWLYNADKTKDYGRHGVKGAVNLFFAAKGLYVAPCSPIPSFSSWVVYKAAPGKSQPNDLLHFIDFQCFDESTCDYIPENFAHAVRAWETLNPGFLALVWTAETISWFFKEDVEKFKTTYKNDPQAYEEMLKLKIIHRFGGTWVHESVWPLQGFQSYADLVRESAAGPVAFCEDVAENESGRFVDNCETMSRFLISGNRGDRKILELANKHEQAFGQGLRTGTESLQLSDSILSTDQFHIFKTRAPFPCNSFSLSPECVGQVSY